MNLLIPLALVALGAAPQELSKDGVELFGWTADGTKVAWIEHGVYDGKGTPWAKVTFFDTTKKAPLGKPLELELEGDSTREDAVAEAKKRADAEWKRLKLPARVQGKAIATDEKGELTGSDGGPVGTLTVTMRKGKKVSGSECPDGLGAELVSAKLDLMGGDGTIKVFDEKKTPVNRACSSGCKPSSTYGQGKGAVFVLTCTVQGFEGPDTRALILPLGKLEYPLESDIPPQ